MGKYPGGVGIGVNVEAQGLSAKLAYSPLSPVPPCGLRIVVSAAEVCVAPQTIVNNVIIAISIIFLRFITIETILCFAPRLLAILLPELFERNKKRHPRPLLQRTSTCAFIFYLYYRLVNVIQGGTSVSRISCRIIVGGKDYEPHLIRCQILF